MVSRKYRFLQRVQATRRDSGRDSFRAEPVPDERERTLPFWIIVDRDDNIADRYVRQERQEPPDPFPRATRSVFLVNHFNGLHWVKYQAAANTSRVFLERDSFRTQRFEQ